jgi:hypothetical protein
MNKYDLVNKGYYYVIEKSTNNAMVCRYEEGRGMVEVLSNKDESSVKPIYLFNLFCELLDKGNIVMYGPINTGAGIPVVKPAKPVIVVGDYVKTQIDTNCILTEKVVSIEYNDESEIEFTAKLANGLTVESDECEKWTPLKGDLCWVSTEKSPVVYLGKFSEFNKENEAMFIVKMKDGTESLMKMDSYEPALHLPNYYLKQWK